MKMRPKSFAKRFSYAVKLGAEEFVMGYVSQHEEHGPYHLEVISVPAQGMNAQGIADIGAAEAALLTLIERAERLFNADVAQISLQIDDRFLRTHKFYAGMNLDTLKPISGGDLAKLDLHAAKLFNEPHAELLFKNPLQFRIDDGSMLHNPQGLYGSQIEAEYLGVYVTHSQLRPYIKLCNQCGLQVTSLASAMLSTAEWFLKAETKEKGCALIDIGKYATTAAVFRNGILDSLQQIPLGSQHITRDLMQGLNLNEIQANAVKRSFGMVSDGIPSSLTVVTQDQQERLIAWRDATEIMAPRVRELATLVARQLRPYKGALSGGLILAGGGSVLKGLHHYLQDQLRIQVTMAGALSAQRPDDVELRIHSNELSSHYYQDPSTKFASVISLLYHLRMGMNDFNKELHSHPYRFFMNHIVNWVRELQQPSS